MKLEVLARELHGNNLFLTKIVSIITVTPVSGNKKTLEAVRYKAALFNKISSLMFMSHGPFVLTKSLHNVFNFVVVKRFDYFSRFLNCNISGHTSLIQ